MPEQKSNMKFKKALSIAPLLLISACSNQFDCSSKEVRGIISELAKENEFFYMAHQISEESKISDISNSLRKQAEVEEQAIQKNISIRYGNIQSLKDQCKTLTTQSESIRKIENEANALSIKLSEVEKIKLVQPKQFFWGASSTQQQHDAWALAEAKYQQELSKKEDTSKILYRDKEARLASITASKDFVEKACQSATRREVGMNELTKVITPSEISHITTQPMYLQNGISIPESLIKEVTSFIETKISPEVNLLTAEEQNLIGIKNSMAEKISTQLSNIKTNLDSDFKTANYVLDDIITSNKNETTGALTCKAKITGKFNQASYDANIAYLVEKTSENKIYATILKVR